MLDYESLKAMAKSIGRPITDLLALNYNNDPFYAGIGQRRRAAEWFAAIWADHGKASSHLRRLHYRLVMSAAPILKPNGTNYENTENDWHFLCNASLAARYLDLIPFDALVDRRNDEPMFFARNVEADPNRKVQFSCSVYGDQPSVHMPDTPDMPVLPYLYLNGVAPVQKFIVEVWIEKSTQNDWLVPLCQRRGVNLMVGIGEQSETRSRELALRSAKYGAPVRVIYISDFDPGGRSMPKAVARKVEFSIGKLNLDVDLKLIPLALTPDQCREYGLPRTPIKDTERRKDKFERLFGVGATELDALESLYPGELARLVDAEIDNWLDPNLNRRFNRVVSDLNLRLRQIVESVREQHADEIEALEQSFDEITQRFDEIASELDDWETEAGELWQTIADEIEEQRPDLSDVKVPRSKAPGETDRFVLFDSRRDYFTQMDAYNAWRDGDESNENGTADDNDEGRP
jgi:hypothetical protein